MKILAFAGSNASKSINRELINYVLKRFTEHEVNFINLKDYELPIFCTDLIRNGYPEAAKLFLQQVKECDAIICSLAEHNRSYTVAFKNLFDWVSIISPKVFQDKPMLLMSASSVDIGGINVINEACKFLPIFGANIKETFSLPKFQDNYDLVEGYILNEDISNELHEKIISFKEVISEVTV